MPAAEPVGGSDQYPATVLRTLPAGHCVRCLELDDGAHALGQTGMPQVGDVGLMAGKRKAIVQRGRDVAGVADAVVLLGGNAQALAVEHREDGGETALGFEIVNDDISGAVHRDRKLITGDSPLAGNNLGKLAAKAMLEDVMT